MRTRITSLSGAGPYPQFLEAPLERYQQFPLSFFDRPPHVVAVNDCDGPAHLRSEADLLRLLGQLDERARRREVRARQLAFGGKNESRQVAQRGHDAPNGWFPRFTRRRPSRQARGELDLEANLQSLVALHGHQGPDLVPGAMLASPLTPLVVCHAC